MHCMVISARTTEIREPIEFHGFVYKFGDSIGNSLLLYRCSKVHNAFRIKTSSFFYLWIIFDHIFYTLESQLIGILVKGLLTSNETRMWLSGTLTFSKTFFCFSAVLQSLRCIKSEGRKL